MEVMKKLLLIITICSFSTLSYAQSIEDIEAEIQKELGAGGSLLDLNSIGSSLTSQLSSAIQASLMEALGGSAIGEVASLKSVVTESFSKQNKLVSSQIQIEQEKNKAMTTISPELADYYNQLDLAGKLSSLGSDILTTKKRVQELKHLSIEQKNLYNYLADNLGKLGQLRSQIKTATNQGEQVWMSEADRVSLLNEADKTIKERSKLLAELYIAQLKTDRALESNKIKSNKYKKMAGF